MVAWPADQASLQVQHVPRFKMTAPEPTGLLQPLLALHSPLPERNEEIGSVPHAIGPVLHTVNQTDACMDTRTHLHLHTHGVKERRNSCYKSHNRITSRVFSKPMWRVVGVYGLKTDFR